MNDSMQARADQLIQFLNELLVVDAEAIHELTEARVPCNKALSEHPTVQVTGSSDKPLVGLLGILNGYVGADTDGWGLICAEYDDHTQKLVRFTRTPYRIK